MLLLARPDERSKNQGLDGHCQTHQCPRGKQGAPGSGAGRQSPGVEARGPAGRGWLRTPRRTQRARMVRVAGRHRSQMSGRVGLLGQGPG